MRSRLPAVLASIATVFAALAIVAVWADRQLLEDEAWHDTSSALLENEVIRAQVAGYLVDELYAHVDVVGEVEALLPPRAAELAGPAAAGLRELAERATVGLLGRPHAHERWQRAIDRAHAAFVRLVEGDGPGGGDVVLHLGELLEATQQRAGVGGRVAERLPPEAAGLTIVRADRLGTARDLANALQVGVVALCVLALALYAAAVALARERRREALRTCGLGLVAVGAAVLVVRSLAGHEVVDALVASDASQPAAEAAWSIATSLLAEIATAVIGYGLVIVAGAWLMGPTPVAVRARARLAPYVRQPHIAYGGAAAIVLLLLLWDPVPATHRLVPMTILCVLLAAGVAALRRQAGRQ